MAITNQSVSFKISLTDATEPTIFYVEKHTVTTTLQGVATLVVGNGELLSGNFATIPWANGGINLQIEIDPLGGENYAAMGSELLQSVPYSLFAASGNEGPAGAQGEQGPQGLQGDIGPQGPEGLLVTGSTGQILTNDGIEWVATSDIHLANGNIGVGTTTPSGRLDVKSNDATEEEPVFAVRNNAGEIVFAVYQNGVRMYVEETPGKGSRGGFAIGGIGDNIKTGTEYFRVTPDSVRVNLREPTVKGSRGGFAIGGIGDNIKTQPSNLFYIGQDSARIYINTEPTAKGSRGGFAIGGIGDNIKGEDSELMRVTKDSTRVYVNTNPAKGSRGGFAIGGIGDNIKGETSFMHLTPENYFIGHESGMGIQPSGLYNSTLGYQTGKALTTGRENIFVGYQAGFSNTSGWGNTAIGYKSLRSNTIGKQNVANGYEAMYSCINGDFNVANGYQSLYTNSSGAYNVANGYQALYSNTNGNYNAAYGHMALYSNSTGQDNTAIGYQAMYFNISAQQNVAIGKSALFNANTNYNVAIGNSALYSNTTGSYNTALGFSAFYSGTAWVNSTAIGYGTAITASRQIRLGNASIESIGGQVGWTTVSDARFKNQIKENVPGLDFILKLRPVTYHLDMNKIANFLHTPDSVRTLESENLAAAELHTGFVAQEVEETANKLGFVFSGVDKPKNSNDYYGLRYAEFTVPLVKAVQEQQIQIEQLKAENADLKSRLERLEKLIQN
jgi:hypothetical protein